MIHEYLMPIAREVKVKGGRTTVALICGCGNDLFWLYENKLTREEKKQMEPYEKAMDELCSGGFGAMCTRDDDGTIHYWKLTSPFAKKEVIAPEKPAFAGIVSMQAECICCGKVHAIFDNRIHGYDGVFCNEGENLTYQPHYQKRTTRDGLPRKIEIVTENDETLEEFRENTDIDCDETAYSNAFGWISIYAIDAKGKKSKILDFETS